MSIKNFHLLILCITGYLAMAGGALLAPALPEMVVPLQTTAQATGLLMSVFTLSTAIFTLILGHFIDRADRKKILIPSLVVYGLTGIISFFISNFEHLLILRFIQGIGVAGMMTLAFLIIGDSYRGYDSVQAISKMSMALAIGAISAPLIGGGLAWYGWNYPFLFYAFSLPFALVVTVFLPETRDKNQNVTNKGIKEAFSSLRKLPILCTIFMGFAIFFLLYSLIIYVPFMLKEAYGFSSVQSGLMLAIEGLAVVLLASRVRNLADRFSLIRVLIAGFLLVGLSLFCISFTDSIIAVFILLLLFGAGYGLAQTAIDAQIIYVSPTMSKGGILSIHTCMKYLGMSLSPIVLGVILTISDLHTVFIICGIVGIFIALATYSVKNNFNFPVIQSVSDTKIQGSQK
ncbi:MFS transporter [Methanospirillum stamsii]|uniref:MFS transporter n=1 Tax=Methanospirillum stamsii TaxID=1277351 RepID=A0A2V2N4F5_9EURY|nr:MFS transporter [Methanospirillum stamsii]PWR73395.1 MFS transporter [Methanospirillum stamsii]